MTLVGENGQKLRVNARVERPGGSAMWVVCVCVCVCVHGCVCVCMGEEDEWGIARAEEKVLGKKFFAPFLSGSTCDS